MILFGGCFVRAHLGEGCGLIGQSTVVYGLGTVVTAHPKGREIRERSGPLPPRAGLFLDLFGGWPSPNLGRTNTEKRPADRVSSPRVQGSGRKQFPGRAGLCLVEGGIGPMFQRAKIRAVSIAIGLHFGDHNRFSGTPFSRRCSEQVNAIIKPNRGNFYRAFRSVLKSHLLARPSDSLSSGDLTRTTGGRFPGQEQPPKCEEK